MRRALLLLLATAALTDSAEESTLRRASSEARAPRRSSSRPATPPADHRPAGAATSASSLDDDDDDDGLDLLWWIDALSFIDAGLGSGDGHARGSYAPARWPYADGRGWLVWFPPADSPAPTPAERPPALVVRLGVDAARIEDDLQRGGIDARVHLPLRLSCAGRFDWYRERLPDEDVDLRLIGLDASWRAVQFANLAVRLDVGPRWLDDALGTESGWEIGCGLDILPIRPLCLALDAGTGSIGTTSLRHLRLEAGAAITRWQGAIGWERVLIGGVALDGPYLAVRCWL